MGRKESKQTKPVHVCVCHQTFITCPFFKTLSHNVLRTWDIRPLLGRTLQVHLVYINAFLGMKGNCSLVRSPGSLLQVSLWYGLLPVHHPSSAIHILDISSWTISQIKLKQHVRHQGIYSGLLKLFHSYIQGIKVSEGKNPTILWLSSGCIIYEFSGSRRAVSYMRKSA